MACPYYYRLMPVLGCNVENLSLVLKHLASGVCLGLLWPNGVEFHYSRASTPCVLCLALLGSSWCWGALTLVPHATQSCQKMGARRSRFGAPG